MWHLDPLNSVESSADVAGHIFFENLDKRRQITGPITNIRTSEKFLRTSEESDQFVFLFFFSFGEKSDK